MGDMSSLVPWEEFDRDPRSPEIAPLRASDKDRDLALRILSEAYAEGRLARDEFDERADAVHAARTLGDLPAQLADLVPDVAVRPGTGLEQHRQRAVETGLEQHRQRAVEKYARERREALWTFISVSVVCWVIWAATMFGEFPWPLFPMIFTGLNAGRVIFQRDDIISGEIRRREKREAKALREQEKKELPPGGPAE
jgi:hypothetical protein